MLSKLIDFSVRRRWLVLVAVLALAGWGGYNYTRLPIDAVPDITNVQVVINTVAPGYTPLEAEQRITFPLETALAGIPHLKNTRSISHYALSQITAIFEEGTDLYFARQMVNERLGQTKDQLPPGVVPALGPISTGLGEIYFYLVEADANARTPQGEPYTITDLKTVQDWDIRPKLRNVPGVVEVNTIGGKTKQYHVTPFPERLVAYGLSLDDVVAALEKNNATVGAGYIERNGEQYLVRAPGQVTGVDQLRQIVVGTRGGVPVYVRDVAEVAVGSELRTGAAVDHGHETVLGSANLLIGANSRTVARAVDARLAEINRTLPPGVHARPVYNRAVLVDDVISTVKHNLGLGAGLVVVILFALLGHLRAAFIAALVIPLAMLFTVSAMVAGKVTGNLMSLGALDFGIIIDGAVIIIENCLRRLGERRHDQGDQAVGDDERLQIIHDATLEVIRPSLFGVCIIAVVYVPILTLQDVEGKTFIPMAFTVLAALTGATLFSLTFVPAAVALLISGKVSEKESFLVRGAKRVYEPLLRLALANRWIVVALAVVFAGLCFGLLPRLGTEFIPRLDEGDLVIQCSRIAGTSLTQSIQMQIAVDRVVSGFPEVKEAFTRLGTADVATDPMPPSDSDGFVMLKPRGQWPDPKKTKDALIQEMTDALAKVPGNVYTPSQPIAMRFDDLLSGVKNDVAVEIFGEDLNQLADLAQQVAAAVRQVPGAGAVKVEQISGLPFLTVDFDRDALARYGLNVADVQTPVQIALGGRTINQIFDGDRRFDLAVLLPENTRQDLDAIRRLPIPLASAAAPDPNASQGKAMSGKAIPPIAAPAPAYIPLSAVARLDLAPGPNEIRRENGRRRIVVGANVGSGDLSGFVQAVQARINASVKLPPGVTIEYAGQYQNLVSATHRLEIVVPLALLLIFGLLYLNFGEFKDALLVFSGVPLALTGGILAIWLRGIALSITAVVGFIALSGVAVLNGLVMLTFINHLRTREGGGKGVEDAVDEGALTRLRPVLTTALVASLGFVPMAVATGKGAEVQRPLATVVIGGIVSSTLLTLLVLPVLYRLFTREAKNEENPDAAADGPPVARPIRRARRTVTTSSQV